MHACIYRIIPHHALAHVLSALQAELTDGALHALIETYCREAGVRNLQKHIERIYRKVSDPGG